MTTSTPSEAQIGGSDNLSSVYERFGKGDFLASVTGMLAGLGTLVFLSALFAAGAASIDFQINLINAEGTLDETNVLGLVIAAIVVFVSFLVGGFAAGRMSRYSGGVNGLGAGLWAILLVAIFAAAGAWAGAEYNAFNGSNLPNWFAQVDVDELTLTAVLATVIMVAMTLLGGYVGGRIGELYHHRVDAAIVQSTRKER